MALDDRTIAKMLQAEGELETRRNVWDNARRKYFSTSNMADKPALLEREREAYREVEKAVRALNRVWAESAEVPL